MTELCKSSESGPPWYPVSIHRLETLLVKVIRTGRGYSHPYALRKNIAYNLQYLEYLDRTALDIKLSQVLITQTWKTFIIVGCGVVESLLQFLLIAHGKHAKTEWELVCIGPGNAKKMEGETRKIDSHVYRKLSTPRPDQMTFDTIIKKSESKRVLGSNHDIFPKLKKLRKLRNRIHLQEIADSTDTDWNKFNWAEVTLMAEVLRSLLTSNIFHPSTEERAYFDYLLRYEAT